jgi:hypothetical protein
LLLIKMMGRARILLWRLWGSSSQRFMRKGGDGGELFADFGWGGGGGGDVGGAGEGAWDSSRWRVLWLMRRWMFAGGDGNGADLGYSQGVEAGWA